MQSRKLFPLDVAFAFSRGPQFHARNQAAQILVALA
jgi:hypothetical protein